MMKKITDVPIRKFVMIKISYSHEFLQNSIQRRSATVPPCQVPIFVGSYTGKKTNRKMFISVNKAAVFRHQGSHLVVPETPVSLVHLVSRRRGCSVPRMPISINLGTVGQNFSSVGWKVSCVCGATLERTNTRTHTLMSAPDLVAFFISHRQSHIACADRHHVSLMQASSQLGETLS